ncbi:UNVERIFIED_CONTAM: hypothetical protein FKN15_029839 [Acipenser sinensis]
MAGVSGTGPGSGSAAGPVQQGLKEALMETLTAILSPVQEVRAAAEEQVKVLEVTEEFGVHLAELTVNPQGALAIRQLASVILKQYVETHWCAQSEKFRPPETTDRAKGAIRELLPSGLRESISKVRSSVAYAISAIAHWDWPEAWPRLFNLLMEMLVSGDVNAVHGAMRVLTAVKTERGDIEGSGLDSFPPSIRNVRAEETRQEAVKGSCVTAGCRSQTLIPTLASLSQIKVWTANPQQFVEDEDDDTFSYSVRISAQDLLLAVSTEFQNESAAALAAAATRHLQEAEQAKNSGSEHWWKIHEACMLALGSVKSIITENVKTGRIQFDMHGFLTSVILADLNLSDEDYYEDDEEEDPDALKDPIYQIDMQVVSQLLDPRTSEFTATFVGRLVSTLIARAGTQLGDNLDQILRAVLSKMQQAETLSVMQVEPLLEFLCSLPGPTGKPALEFVMSEWMNRQHLFYGQYEGKVSTVALCKLLQHGINTNDKRLQEILVKGDEIFNPDEGIRTRSKTAKNPERWTSIPLLVKIFKLIINELSSVVEANSSRTAAGDWSQESNDMWEDQDHDEEDDDDEEDDGLAGQLLSDLLSSNKYDEDYYEDDEEEDPDALKDPVYQIDMQAYLTDFLRQFAQQPCCSMFSGHLNEAERKILQTIGI